MLFHMNIPKQCWVDAVLTACYLINRIPSTILGGKSPHSILLLQKSIFLFPPQISGCFVFIHQHSPDFDKPDPEAIECVFLGYSRTQKGYRCCNPVLRWFSIYAEITFFKSIFLFGVISNFLNLMSLKIVFFNTPLLIFF